MAELLIDADDLSAWNTSEKVDTSDVEEDLAIQLTAQVLGAVSNKYSTETWTVSANTPALIRCIISMLYIGYLYHRQFSVDDDPGVYATLLIKNAETLLGGVVSGLIPVVDSIAIVNVSTTGVASVADELVDNDPKFLMSMEF